MTIAGPNNFDNIKSKLKYFHISPTKAYDPFK